MRIVIEGRELAEAVLEGLTRRGVLDGAKEYTLRFEAERGKRVKVSAVIWESGEPK